MAEKTEKNPRGAGRRKKPDAEKTIHFTVTAPRPVVEAINALARKAKTTRGLYIQRLLEAEALKLDDDGRRGRLLGDLFGVALEVVAASGSTVSDVEKMLAEAVENPAATFPEILKKCSRELPRVTIANGREELKAKIADLTVALGFSFPESLTEIERAAFETAVEKHNKN